MTKKKIANFILDRLGWKVEPTPKMLLCQKFVLVSGPHTSNWDFVIGKLAYVSLGIDAKFFIKKELFFWPLGYVLKKMGAYPIDRGSARGIVNIIKEMKDEKVENFILTITPEGTRDKTNNWKEGFYTIANKAKVPIFVGTLNYQRRICRIGDPFTVTGNFENDLEQLKEFYNPLYARNPEQFAYHGQNMDE
ncbi:MAG: 1-acyl-sn-glycerol-3-phosphate acyltransferase [Candidatus Absconditabacteria bacterium]